MTQYSPLPFMIPAETGIQANSPPELAPTEFPSRDNSDPNWGRRGVGGVYTNGKDVVSAQLDYPWVGFVKAWKEAAFLLGLLGKQTDDITAATVVGNDFTATYTDDAPVALGAVISWSVARQISQPFNLKVKTSGWRNAGRLLSPNTTNSSTPIASVDREFTLFLCSGLNGGRIYVPFAQRITPSMQIAMPSLATPTDDVLETGGQGLIQVLDVPAAIVSSFSVNVQLMTAHSESLAQFLRRAGIFTQVPQPATVCGV